VKKGGQTFTLSKAPELKNGSPMIEVSFFKDFLGAKSID